MNETRLVDTGKLTRKYVISAIGILIMLFFGFLPAPEPLTRAGMFLLGDFIGLIILVSFVDMMWPNFLAIVLFGAQCAMDVYADTFGVSLHNGVYIAEATSLGNFIVLFVLWILLVSIALEEAGTIRRMALWFVTRKFAKKGAWNFTFMLLAANLIMGLFIDVVPIQVLMLGIAYEIFEVMGYEKKEAWPKITVVAITFTSVLSFLMTPICHPMPLLITQISSSISGVPMNMVKYMLVAIPFGVAVFALLFVWFRFVRKPDVSRFQDFDMKKIDALRPGPMQARERWIVTIIGLTVFFMIAPAFISLIAPGSGLDRFFTQAGDHAAILVCLAALAIVHVDGRPLLDLKSAMQKADWVPVMLLAGTTMVTVAMAESTTGIPAYISSHLLPLVSGLSPFAIIIILGTLACILTNFMMNSGVGILCSIVGTTLAMQLGINPSLVAVVVSVGANLAFLIPSAMAPIGIAYASPWCDGKTVFTNAIAAILISVAMILCVLYPLGSIVF